MSKTAMAPKDRLVSIKISARAYDQVCKHAERYECTVDQVLADITIDFLPIRPHRGRCDLCGEAHATAKCPRQIKMPFAPPEVGGSFA